MGKDKETCFAIMGKIAEEVKFGEWRVKLKIHKGRVTAFEDIEPPKRKFAEDVDNNESLDV